MDLMTIRPRIGKLDITKGATNREVMGPLAVRWPQINCLFWSSLRNLIEFGPLTTQTTHDLSHEITAFICPQMAIPLRTLKSMDSNSHPPRSSLDSETSAILSYALGKHPESEDSDSEPDSPRRSSEQVDSEDFFKENDPLTSDYEPAFPRKQVLLPLVRG